MFWRVWVRNNERDTWRYHNEYRKHREANAAIATLQAIGKQAKADYIGRSVQPNSVRKVDY